MPTPKRLNPYDLNDVVRIRRIRAKLGPPCKDCGQPTLVWSDGTPACTCGIHALERELGIRRSPPKEKVRP